MDATLIRRFGEAGLKLRPALSPIEPSKPEAFQIDIRRLGRTEHFRVWPGREAATVLSTDPKRRRVVLRVGGSRYLCGAVERRLYIARMEGRRTSRPRRLGGWSFVPLAAWELERLEALIAARRAVVLAGEPIEAGGLEAEELVRLPSPGRGPGMSLLVRGALGALRFGRWTSALRDGEAGPVWPDA